MVEKLVCLEYLEKYGGSLRLSPGKMKWPDGTATDFVWYYSSGDLSVSGKTAIDSIKRHMENEDKNKI